MKEIRIGIVGLGFGRDVHIPAFASLPGARISAVNSQDPGKTSGMSSALGLKRTFASWHDLVTSAEVDAVSIATPPYLHAEMVSAAVLAGKAVLCEKPLGLNAAQCSEMLEKARAASVVHMVGFEFREVPAWSLARDIIRSGELGRLRHGHLRWTVHSWSDPTRRWDWRSDRSLGGGVLSALGVHLVDFVEWALAPVASVCSQLTTCIPYRPDLNGGVQRVSAEDSANVLLELEGGLALNLALSSVSARGQGLMVEISGERQSLLLCSRNARDYGKDFGVWLGDRVRSRYRKVSINDSSGPKEVGEDGRIPPFRRLAKRFIEAVSANDTGIAPSFREGWRAQLITDSITQSAQERRWVQVKPAGQS